MKSKISPMLAGLTMLGATGISAAGNKDIELESHPYLPGLNQNVRQEYLASRDRFLKACLSGVDLTNEAEVANECIVGVNQYFNNELFLAGNNVNCRTNDNKTKRVVISPSCMSEKLMNY